MRVRACVHTLTHTNTHTRAHTQHTHAHTHTCNAHTHVCNKQTQKHANTLRDSRRYVKQHCTEPITEMKEFRDANTVVPNFHVALAHSVTGH